MQDKPLKQDQLVALLKEKGGLTIGEIAQHFYPDRDAETGKLRAYSLVGYTRHKHRIVVEDERYSLKEGEPSGWEKKPKKTSPKKGAESPLLNQRLLALQKAIEMRMGDEDFLPEAISLVDNAIIKILTK